MQLPTVTVTLKEFSGKYSPDLILYTNAQNPNMEGRAGSQNLLKVALMLEQR